MEHTVSCSFLVYKLENQIKQLEKKYWDFPDANIKNELYGIIYDLKKLVSLEDWLINEDENTVATDFPEDSIGQLCSNPLLAELCQREFMKTHQANLYKNLEKMDYERGEIYELHGNHIGEKNDNEFPVCILFETLLLPDVKQDGALSKFILIWYLRNENPGFFASPGLTFDQYYEETLNDIGKTPEDVNVVPKLEILNKINEHFSKENKGFISCRGKRSPTEPGSIIHQHWGPEFMFQSDLFFDYNYCSHIVNPLFPYPVIYCQPRSYKKFNYKSFV